MGQKLKTHTNKVLQRLDFIKSTIVLQQKGPNTNLSSVFDFNVFRIKSTFQKGQKIRIIKTTNNK